MSASKTFVLVGHCRADRAEAVAAGTLIKDAFPCLTVPRRAPALS